jgi:putative ABC transport system substrate-binding protein
MRRREFIRVLGGAAAIASPLPTRAQSMPVIGFLSIASAAQGANLVTAFGQGLSEAGVIEGQSAAIAYRWAEGQRDRLAGLVADLLERRVAVIAAHGVVTARAAKTATWTGSSPIAKTIGIVVVGLVASLNRPDGNVGC